MRRTRTLLWSGQIAEGLRPKEGGLMGVGRAVFRIHQSEGRAPTWGRVPKPGLRRTSIRSMELKAPSCFSRLCPPFPLQSFQPKDFFSLCFQWKHSFLSNQMSQTWKKKVLVQWASCPVQRKRQ